MSEILSFGLWPGALLVSIAAADLGSEKAVIDPSVGRTAPFSIDLLEKQVITGSLSRLL